MAVISAGTQLVLLGESGGGSVQEPEGSDSDPASIQSRLRQTELDWSSLLLELPGVQQELHKVRRVLQRVCVYKYFISVLKLTIVFSGTSTKQFLFLSTFCCRFLLVCTFYSTRWEEKIHVCHFVFQSVSTWTATLRR